MATKLDKSLKRELELNGVAYMIAISPEGLKITVKGRRNGVEMPWKDLISGQAALATAPGGSPEQAQS